MSKREQTERVANLLVLLCEEAAEVIQSATKVLRFGVDGSYSQTGENNIDHLVNELNDLQAVVGMLQDERTLPDIIFSSKKIEDKRDRIEGYLYKWSSGSTKKSPDSCW